MPGAYLEAWDGTKWIKVLVDATGRLSTVVTLPHLNDIEDVEVTEPTNLYILYYNSAELRYELRAFTDWLHKTAHQAGGTDVISVAGLAGELTARQKSKCGSSVLGWTANKLLKGAGTGSNPTLIDVPTGLSNNLLFPYLSWKTPPILALDGTPIRTAHSIRPLEAVTITRIGILINDLFGNPGTLYCEIWDDSGGNPNAVIANGSSSMAQGSLVDHAFNWLIFATPPSLTANTLYWIVLRGATISAENRYNLRAFDGTPSNGKGFWGVGTIAKSYADTTWSDDDPIVDIIIGGKA